MFKVGDRVATNAEPGPEVTVLRESDAGSMPYLVRTQDQRWTWVSDPSEMAVVGDKWEDIAYLARGGYLVAHWVTPREAPVEDVVNTPSHYAERVPGVECISVTQHFNFNRGNTIKYVWRAGTKGDAAQEIEDLNKARKYLEFEILRLGGEVK
jgi:hypothetical protein